MLYLDEDLVVSIYDDIYDGCVEYTQVIIEKVGSREKTIFYIEKPHTLFGHLTTTDKIQRDVLRMMYKDTLKDIQDNPSKYYLKVKQYKRVRFDDIREKIKELRLDII